MAKENIQLVEVSLDEDLVAQNGPLYAMQVCLVNRLTQEDHYTGLSILYEQSLEILYEVEKAVESIGMVVTIMTPQADDESPNVPIATLDRVTIVAQVTETPIINRAEGGTMIPSAKIAWLIMSDLKKTIVNGARILTERIWQEVDEEAGVVVWNVRAMWAY